MQEKIISEVRVVEEEKAALGGFLSMMGPKKEEKPKVDKNEVVAEIYKRMGREKLLFARGTGNYARYLQIGGQLFYEHSKVEHPVWVAEEPGEFTLPSSSVKRRELAMIREHRDDEADQ